MRTNYCGDLRKSDVGTAVHLFGWVQKRRDLGGLVFIDMRDRGGIVQVCFDPKNPELIAKAQELRVRRIVGGTDRVDIEAFHQAVKNFHIQEAANIVVAIATNSQSDFKLGELMEMNNCLQDKLGKCDIVWGTRTDNSLADTEISMFVLAGIR